MDIFYNGNPIKDCQHLKPESKIYVYPYGDHYKDLTEPVDNIDEVRNYFRTSSIYQKIRVAYGTLLEILEENG